VQSSLRLHFLLLPSLVLAVGCGSSVSATDGGSDSAPRNDASATRCVWRQSRPHVTLTGGAPRFRLLDAVAGGSGAWLVVRESRPGGGDVLLSGEFRDAPEYTFSTNEFTAVPPGATPSASIASGPRDERYLLADGAGASGGCVFGVATRVGIAARPVDFAAVGMGFSLTGCASLALAGGALSFLSEQVRAVYGTELLGITRDGALSRRAVLPMADHPPVSPTVRSALPDGSSASVYSVVAGMGMPPQFNLRVQHLTEGAIALAPPAQIATLSGEPLGPVVVSVEGGPVVAWGGAVDTFPPVFSLMARAIDPVTFAPRGAIAERTELGILSGAPHATGREGEVLVTARVSDGGTRQVFAALSPTNLEAGATVTLNLPALGSGAVSSRVIATAAGAVVFTTVDVGPSGGTLVAVPLECAR
jgi:hypothetical protein